jgi:glycosyltransferase involved in cell wall biosynthesis
MSDGTTVSVLLPVHQGVEPDVFRQALDSVLDQTRPADEIVVVEDGPLTSQHDVVLRAAESRHPALLRVRLTTNQGAGVANQAGLEVASGDWIAKSDADDISVPTRLEAQLNAVRQSQVDVCGSAMLEFDGAERDVTAIRIAPLSHDAIATRMRTNNPVNHPTALYRRTLALRAGGYPDMRFMQDYVLFARVLRDGARFMNLPEPLVHFRADAGMHARRALRPQARLEWRLQKELTVCGVVSPLRRWWNLGFRLGYRSLPTAVRRLVHERVLARAPSASSVAR